MYSRNYGPTVQQVQKTLDNFVLYHERRLRNLEADYRRSLDTETNEALFNVERAIDEQRILISNIPRHIVRTFVVQSLTEQLEHCYAVSTVSTAFKVSLDGWQINVIPQQGLWQVAEIVPGSICEYGLVISVNGGPKISEPARDAAIQAYWDQSNRKQSQSDAVQRRWHEKEVEARAQRRAELKAERSNRSKDETERRRRFDEAMSQSYPAPTVNGDRNSSGATNEKPQTDARKDFRSRTDLLDRAWKIFRKK